MTYVPPNYAPTVDPGDTRERIWINTNFNQLGAVPTCEMRCQLVVKLKDGTESPLRDTRTLTKVPVDFNELVTLRHPITDEVIGMSTV